MAYQSLPFGLLMNARKTGEATEAGRIAKATGIAQACIGSDELRKYGCFMLSCAIIDGSPLATLCRLADQFGITAADIRDNFDLRTACRYRDLATVRWLVERFGLTANDVQAGNYEVLRIAISRGFGLGEWLVEHFGLTVEDAQASIIAACECGDLDTAEWLAWRFSVSLVQTD